MQEHATKEGITTTLQTKQIKKKQNKTKFRTSHSVENFSHSFTPCHRNECNGRKLVDGKQRKDNSQQVAREGFHSGCRWKRERSVCAVCGGKGKREKRKEMKRETWKFRFSLDAVC
jgi:hypothetical protein